MSLNLHSLILPWPRHVVGKAKANILYTAYGACCGNINIHMIEERTMQRNDILSFLRDFKTRCADKYGIISLGVFGSVARGESMKTAMLILRHYKGA